MARSSALIADAGPLIALSRIGALDLLQGAFGEAWVTSEVRAEVLPAADYPGKADLVAALERGKLQLLPRPPKIGDRSISASDRASAVRLRQRWSSRVACW